MRLYKRDFTKLTESEKTALDKFNQHEQLMKTKIMAFPKAPKAVWRYTDLFPNHYLDTAPLKQPDKVKKWNKGLKKIIDSKTATERKILNYIKKERAYHIIASLLRNFHFGHHGAYLFPELQLAPNFIVDYVIVGKSSMGYEFVFVEIESPIGNITTKDGSYGQVIRNGLKQIEDWDQWLEANFQTMRLVFDKYKGPQATLPSEFLAYDKTRVHYVVIAGRREHFNDKTNRLQRKGRTSNTHLLHYDNLLDFSESSVGGTTY